MYLRNKKGFTLIELLITLLISAIVSYSVYSIFDQSSDDYNQVKNTSELQTEAQALFNIIERDLSKGGFVHPIRGNILTDGNCVNEGSDGAIPAAHVLFIAGDNKGASACFDIPSYDGTIAYRYKVTYRLGAIGASYDDNTLYKKVERTDNCVDIITSESTNPDFNNIVHAWQPVSENIGSLAFTNPTIGSTNENIVDLDMEMQAKTDSSVKLNFRKRIFLRNKPLSNSSTRCDDKCPNSKDLFADYNISTNEMNWDPDTRTVPSARVVISENYVEDEDELQWDTDMATDLGLTVGFTDDTGILSISGSTTARNYERFLRTVNYVNTVNDRTARTTFMGDDRQFILTLGFAGLCEDLIGREVGAVRHFYCYVENITDGKGAWTGSTIGGNDQLWWGQARLRAENSTYYNLSGYLASITSTAENDYVLDKIRDDMNNPIAAWFGGTDNSGGEANLNNATEGTWVWSGGPERNDIFFTTAAPGVDGFADGFTNWRNGEPNNCCTGMYNNDYNGSNLETLGGMTEHYPNSSGEHYTQFSDQISGTGYWNDLFVPGVTYEPFQTIGYVLEFSTNWPQPLTPCGNGSETARLACANYFFPFELVLDDTSYTDPDMLNLCDPNPTDNVAP